MGDRKVEIDPRSGFCFGVVRAIGIAEKFLASGGGLISLGDIVHNEAEVERLERMGLRTVGELTDIGGLASAEVSEASGGTAVLIRAHGEPPATFDAARLHGVTLIDATCPVVAALGQTVAQAFNEMAEVGGQVVIFGRRGHAEVRGLVGQVNGNAIVVVENFDDLEAIDFARPIYFLAQTTGSLAEFRRLADEIERRARAAGAETGGRSASGNSGARVTVKDTICRQVADREALIGEFASRHDVVVFVAGEKSSNGKVLFDAVRRANPRSHKVQNANDLRAEWFDGGGQADGDLSIGVCGATSTPRWLMECVKEAILSSPHGNEGSHEYERSR